MKYIANPVEVDAFRIIEVHTLHDGKGSYNAYMLEDGRLYRPTAAMLSRIMPEKGDYLVMQADGYEYLNQKAVFERKYHEKPIAIEESPREDPPPPITNGLKAALCVVFALLFGVAVQAQDALHVSPAGHVLHYIATHKSLLAVDAVVMAALLADSYETQRCLDRIGCVETNPILGKHPSTAALYARNMAIAAGAIALDHGVWWVTGRGDPNIPGKSARYFEFGLMGALATAGAISAKNNADIADRLGAARARLIQ